MDTNLLAPNSTAPGPRYRALADRICAAVDAGDLAPGEKLPPVRDLAFALKISPGAVARAYRLGQERGVLEATVGSGTYVRGSMRAPEFAFAGITAARDPGMIDLRGNQAADVGQEAEIGAALERILRRWVGRPPLLGYRRREDDPEFLSILSGWLVQAGVPAAPDRLIVTTGAQAGVVAVLSLLGRGGAGVVLTDTTSYPGFRDGAAMLGERMEPIASDGEGVQPDALDAACARLRPDAILLSPTLHNPTLATMGPARRAAVVAVARRHGVQIVEDDVYGRLMEPTPTPLAALAPDLVWHVTSFSKCVAAGLRVGLILAPEGRAEAGMRAYQAFAHQNPWISAALATELVATGEAEAIRKRVAAETSRRAARAAALLGPYGARTHPAASFAFLPLGEEWSAGEFVAAAAAEGVLVPPAASYRVGRNGAVFARIALSGRAAPETVEEGLMRLARVLAAGPDPAPAT